VSSFVTTDQVEAAAAEILAAVVLRNGEPDHKWSGGDPESDAFLSWENGTFLRWSQTGSVWWLGVREKGRAWPAPRWLAFEVQEGGDLLRQLPTGSFDRPAFAITEERSLVEVQVSDVRSGLYFLSTCDLSRVHRTREGAGARPCELCLEPVVGDYVERVHRQGGDQRRSHLSCAQAAIDGVLREQIQEAELAVSFQDELDAVEPRPEPDAFGPECFGGEDYPSGEPDTYFANYVAEQSEKRRRS